MCGSSPFCDPLEDELTYGLWRNECNSKWRNECNSKSHTYVHPSRVAHSQEIGHPRIHCGRDMWLIAGCTISLWSRHVAHRRRIPLGLTDGGGVSGVLILSSSGYSLGSSYGISTSVSSTDMYSVSHPIRSSGTVTRLSSGHAL